MTKMPYHKLSPTICDYEQLISIGYKYKFGDKNIMIYLHSLWFQPYNISELITFQQLDKMSPAIHHEIMSHLW